MKFLRQANGNDRIKISKSEWESLGVKAGWMKTSMPVPITDEDRASMARDGIFVLLDIHKKLPATGKRKMEALIKDMQADEVGDFFSTLDPKNAITLPAIYKADPKNIVDIDGAQYYVVSVTEPRVAGKKQTVKDIEYTKGDAIPGEIICMDVETGKPISFVYEDVVDKIKMPQDNREQTLEQMNNEIAAWNKRVETLEDAVGPTKLALQVAWAENKVSDRVGVLDAQIEALHTQQSDPLGDHPGYANWVQALSEGIRNGTFNLRDVFDSLMYLYQSTPQELISGIENGTVEVPDEMRNGLLAIAAQELQLKNEKDLAKVQKDRAQEARIEEELTLDKVPTDEPLRPLELEDIPEEKYKTLKKNKTLWSWSASINAQIVNIRKDKAQLEEVLGSLKSLRGYIGELGKGQRAKDYLRSPEGQPIVDTLKSFLNIAQTFIKRYSVDIIENGTINSSLMGRGGTLGNSLLAVALNRIYVIIQKTLAEVTEPAIEHLVDPVREELDEAPAMEGLEEQIAKSKDKITRMSELLWGMFEEKGKLR